MRLKPPPPGRSRAWQLILGVGGCWIAAGGVAFTAELLGAGHRGRAIAGLAAFAIFLLAELIDTADDAQ
jgi:hypothetical protein